MITLLALTLSDFFQPIVSRGSGGAEPLPAGNTLCRMHVEVTRPDHPEVTEVVASQHCVERFRKRRGIREPGVAAVAVALAQALQDADFTRWPPAWVDSDRRTEMWALTDDLAFPLAATSRPGRWLATTCLVRGMTR